MLLPEILCTYLMKYKYILTWIYHNPPSTFVVTLFCLGIGIVVKNIMGVYIS